MKYEEPMKFIQDDSCHWYIIPVSVEKEFHEWVRVMSDEGSVYLGYDDKYDFDQYRIDGGPTYFSFTELVNL